MFKRHLPSPAIVISLIALFVALSGTAVAAGVVPLAKRALTADNSKKVGGKTAAQLTTEAAAKPGPASSAAGLVSVRTTPFALTAGQEQMYQVACAAGEKAVSGGFVYDGDALVQSADSAPSTDGAAWRMYLVNFSDTSGASGTLQAVCLR